MHSTQTSSLKHVPQHASPAQISQFGTGSAVRVSSAVGIDGFASDFVAENLGACVSA